MSTDDARRFCERALTDLELSKRIDSLKRGDEAFHQMADFAKELGYTFTGEELSGVVGDMINARERIANEDLARRVHITLKLNERAADPMAAGWTMDEHWQVAIKRR